MIDGKYLVSLNYILGETILTFWLVLNEKLQIEARVYAWKASLSKTKNDVTEHLFKKILNAQKD